MRRYVAWVGGLVLGMGLGLAGGPAQAVIMRLTPLKDILAESHYIFTAKVDSLDPDKPVVVLVADEDLKEKAPFRKLTVNLTGDAEAKKDKHTPQLLKRLAPKLPLVVFVSKAGPRHVAFGYTNGTWFQMVGQKADDSDAVRWSFTHCEPYLRRTFKGTTDEMKQVVADALADKKKPPEPDAKEQPGFGPEVKEEDKPKDKEEARIEDRPVYAVIPTVLVGGPLAILAMLFPAVFGGLTGQIRRWLALISVASLNGTIYAFYSWNVTRRLVEGTRLSSDLAMWLLMTSVTLLGLLWAWRRHARAVQSGQPMTEGPGRWEQVALWVMSLAGIGMVAYCWIWQQGLLEAPWSVLLVLWVGVWGGTLYGALTRLSAGRAVLPVEGVMLLAMAFAGTVVAATLPRGSVGGAVQTGDADLGGEAERVVTPGKVAWFFEAPDGGTIASSPLVAGDRVYVTGAHFSAFTNHGAVYCLDRSSGKLVWKFTNGDEGMKKGFSSPVLAEGRLYVGEGWHEDPECKLYCLDADTGKKLWAFPTGSHTESSPRVVNGKVFFGAGDDGVYCVDAATGAKVWQYQGLHVDVNLEVVGNRVYGGSCEGDVYKDFALFCLDAATGDEVWRVPTDLPVPAAPVAAGGHLYFSLGNGKINLPAPQPKGVLLCLEAATQREVWRYELNESIMGKPAVDRHSVYFGSCGADGGHLLCLARQDGRLRWKRDMGSAVYAAPAVVRCPCCGASTSVYAAADAGLVACLDPATGRDYWTFDLAASSGRRPGLISSPAVVLQSDPDGEARRIYLGATLDNQSARLYCFEDRMSPR